ncbi:hypothetical protein PENCOP_c001G02872 [Penicillium coprophilum]|uniref:Uncharacterized protein n=1 Tax=Penicillium coprophilum TaxID=36646 RepID=A0A1V6V6Z2_9EURO|nr:hypothetical protein PENCOP_c001G02872 [Penicillium coprophilum]
MLYRSASTGPRISLCMSVFDYKISTLCMMVAYKRYLNQVWGCFNPSRGSQTAAKASGTLPIPLHISLYHPQCHQIRIKVSFHSAIMASPKADFPAIRACIFDMSGLLINSEDIIALSTNQLLGKYGRPPLTRSIQAQLMGVADSTNGDVFHNWAKLPISREQFARESRSESKRLLSFLHPDRRVLGADPRVRQGQGKPAPDIYLLALQSLNVGVGSEGNTILPRECLVFEDSIAGVEAGRRAGMRVVWVPHPDVVAEYQSMHKDILAGKSGMFKVGDDWQLGEIDDGWAESIPSLEDFDYEKYGLEVAPEIP